MSSKQKQYRTEFKAKVALEAIRGAKTVSELASQYEIYPTMRLKQCQTKKLE